MNLLEKLLGREKGEAPPPGITHEPPVVDPVDVDDPHATKSEPKDHPAVGIPDQFGNDWPECIPRVRVRAKLMEEPFSVKEPDGKYRRGEPGDYMVVANGDAYVCPGDVFNSTWIHVA